MPLMLLAVWIWGWSAIRTNCDGTVPISPITGYGVEVATKQGTFAACTMQKCCVDGQEPCLNFCPYTTLCVSYTMSAWNQVDFVQQPAGADVGTSKDLPVPAVNAVSYMRIVTYKGTLSSLVACPSP